MSGEISIASVCRSLPNPADPSSGIFVHRRLSAMARKARVRAIQPVPYFPGVRPLPDWARQPGRQLDGVDIVHAPMFYVPGVLKSLDGYWLQRAIREPLTHQHGSSGVDIVDAHFGYPEGAGALDAARKLGVPVTVTLRGFEAEYLEKPLIAGQIQRVIRQADGLICVSHFLEELALRHGARPDRLCVIHNAIDRNMFFPADRAKARRELGIPADVPLVVSVGHFVVRKRHHVLVEAFARFAEAHPGARLVIVGGAGVEPGYLERLKTLVAERKLGDAVLFPGNVPTAEVARYYHAADVFALGTQREGCCNAVLEALACGLPVVTTPVGDNAHFVHDGDNGFIVPVDDAGAMARALTDAVSRKDWDAAAISRGLPVGDWHGVADRVLAFLARTVGRARG